MCIRDRPSEKEKAKEICGNLRIKEIAERSDSSPDVKPYIQETDTEWVLVDLVPEMKIIQRYIKLALDQRYTELRRNGLRLSDNKSLSQLLNARQFVLKQNRRSAKPLFTAIRITYALNIFEAHGVTSFLKFCERTQSKKGAGIKELFEIDPNFTSAINLAKSALSKGIEHPKIIKLVEILSKVESKVLIFSSYRDSVATIHKKLVESNVTAEILIGKAGKTGLKQDEQIETVQRFKDGTTKVLVATRVGEEGLDISDKKGRLAMPLYGKILNKFGKKRVKEYDSYIVYNGINVKATKGTHVKAVFDGKILFAGELEGYGNLVIIGHGNKYHSLYGHLDDINVSVDKVVKTGEIIGLSGDSGSLEGEVLYFELRRNGKPIQPLPWFKRISR